MKRQDRRVAVAKAEVEAAIRDFESKARSLQIHLQAEGLYKDAIDGDWGPRSRAALRRYLAKFHQVPI